MGFQLFPAGVPARKRIFDLLLTLPLLLIFSPIMLVISLVILIFDGPSVFFTQPRPGYHCQIFNVIKFRSMRSAFDRRGRPLPDDQRLSPLGRFLRASSLDELPEMISILAGKMSLVGPRPLLVQYLDRYTPEQIRRHDCLPGLTGWAQVNGRNALSWEDKFRLDVWYVDHWSLKLDIKILALTVWKVLKREGISQPGQATSEEFMGPGPHTYQK